MKLVIACLALVGFVSAGKPQLSISVRDGSFEGLDGLDPTISWESSTQAGDVDISYGIKATARATSDIASIPRSVWGKARTSVSGWGVSARAELGNDLGKADLQIDADNQNADLNVHLVANAGSGFNVRSVEATKGFDANGARVTITPRVNLEDDNRDVVINYSNDKTNVKLTASADNQEVTISQQIDDNNRVAPTLARNGEVSLEWERRLSDDSSLTANLKPNDNLSVEWKDSAWTANVRMPIEGTSLGGPTVSIKRDVTF